MTALTLPAPLWRRLMAAVYDGLLALGLWMVAALLEVMIRDQLLGLPRHRPALMAYFFLVGLGFFGWFWTHGGQTLGMRAWRLRSRRLDGQPLRWSTAATRYATMLLFWGIALTPLALGIDRIAAAQPQSALFGYGAVVILALSILLARLDARRRLPQDWISGCEVVAEPKGG